MSVDGPHDLAQLRLIGKLVAKARDAMLKEVRPGVSTAELDEVGRSVLEASGARSAPRLAYNFPGFTCISVNEELAHGIVAWCKEQNTAGAPRVVFRDSAFTDDVAKTNLTAILQQHDISDVRSL